jgi:hypothetical protein
MTLIRPSKKSRSAPPGATRSAPSPKLTPPVAAAVRTPGEPIPAGIRAALEQQFDADLSSVRIHTGAQNDRAGDLLHARAFTVGEDIVVNGGAPGSELLAHEVAHVLQQRSGASASNGAAAVEGDANRAASAFASGAMPQVSEASAPSIAFQTAPGRDPSTLSDEALATEIENLRRYILDNPDAPEVPRLTEELLQMEAVAGERLEKQRAAQAPNPANAAISGPGAGAAIAAGATLALPGVGIGGTAAGATTTTGAVTSTSILGTVVLPLAAAAAVLLYPSEIASEEEYLEEDRRRAAEAAAGGTAVLSQAVGNQIRGQTTQVMIHRARILGAAVGGMPPDHHGDPERDRPHWWKEIKGWIAQILSKGLTNKQLVRELLKKFSEGELQEIRQALQEAARRMGEKPPDFPPLP